MTATLLLSAFLMGLLGSTHCVVMCGGVVGMLCGGLTPLGTKPRPLRSAKLTLAYNVGRIASYATAGIAAGAFGALVDRVDALRDAQIGLRIAAGLLMVGVGLYLAGAWRRFAAIERIGAPLWRRIEPHARRLLPVRNVGSALLLGALWGWMPCGLVYAALGVALGTGSALGGAASMIAFGAGTLPALLTMGAVATRVAELTRRMWVRRAAGLAVVAFGLFNVATASAQAGWTHAAPHHACCAGKDHHP